MIATEDSIVFVNQNAGYLMIDIVRAHQTKYKDVALITGKLITRGTFLDSAITIEKIIPYDRSSVLRRIFTWISGFVQICFLVKTKYRHADLYIVSNPPFATLLPLFCKNRFHLLIFDVYPDALVEYKMFKRDSWLIRLWRKANTKIYARASNVFTLTQGMRTLLAEYVPAEKIQVVPIWTDNSFLKPVLKSDNPFIAQHRLNGKFLVIYSGNLGYTHELEVLTECARRVTDPRIMFVIIGEGEKKKSLAEKVTAYRLENFILLPWQDVSVLPFSLAAADVGVVTLGKEASLLSVPSKTYNLMSVGAPLLCVAAENSELAHLVRQFELGQCFAVDDIGSMVSYLEMLASDERYLSKLRENSLSASKEFGSENVQKLLVV